MLKNVVFLVMLSGVFVLAGCSDDPVQTDAGQPTWLGTDYGHAPTALSELVPGGKADGRGTPGPQVAWDNDRYQVWAVRHQWDEVTNEEGLAWVADSGLTWNEKYVAWVESLPAIPHPTNERLKTFELTTPHGKNMIAPVLECAEVAIFLRIAFASWYGLPFYMQAADNGRPVYLGHFGFRQANGASFANSPPFRERYRDYVDTWQVGETWPTDTKLRRRGLYGGGDQVPFLPAIDDEPARAGAYFDEIFLNKRVGHFMLLALSWFGSMHLADGANMFHVKAEGFRAGDVILLRWQRRGIGHTVPVMRVSEVEDNRFEVAVASGSMPRRFPTWEEGGKAARYFKKNDAGGEGVNDDDDAFAALGGGVRRWRVATAMGQRYMNTFAQGDESLWINSRNLEAIAERITIFEELLRELTPDQKRDLAIQLIEDARTHLRKYPASCNARKRREEGFAALYEVNEAYFWMSKENTDATYRTLEDYVYNRLEYGRSRTCCWNSTTTAMHEIIMEHARAWVDDPVTQMCREPLVFMARDVTEDDDGYALYRNYAETLGRGQDWVQWSADEECPQGDVSTTDVSIAENNNAFCAIADLPTMTDGCGDTGTTWTEAPSVEFGTSPDRLICRGEADLWTFTGSGWVTISIKAFAGDGDLDLAVVTVEDEYIDGAFTHRANETVTVDLGPSPVTVGIRIYAAGNRATRGYQLLIEPAPTPAVTSDSQDTSDQADAPDNPDMPNRP
ncbi:MAG: hypothetical protein VX589_20545 [Myxococcota bacterium]|nr:hypothetical protein [Myxococcota bacterium]